MESVNLPPELEQFATDAVASGRYRDVDEVVAAGIGLLRQAEVEVATFVRSLENAQAEAERDGCRSAHDVHREMASMLDEMAQTRT